jgi:hypothetical protein
VFLNYEKEAFSSFEAASFLFMVISANGGLKENISITLRRINDRYLLKKLPPFL